MVINLSCRLMEILSFIPVPVRFCGQMVVLGQVHRGAAYQLTMQNDGNIVEYCYNTQPCNYGNGYAVWATNTGGHAGATLTMHVDHFSIINAVGDTEIAYSCGMTDMCT